MATEQLPRDLTDFLRFEFEPYHEPRYLTVKPGPRVSRRMKKYMKKIGQWKYKGKFTVTYEFYMCDEETINEQIINEASLH
jgi:hypothetical protein